MAKTKTAVAKSVRKPTTAATAAKANDVTGASAPSAEHGRKKKLPNRVPPQIVRRAHTAAKPNASNESTISEFDAAKAVAFAMAIAQEKKRSAAKAEVDSPGDVIRLTRRPTTRSQGRQTVKFPAEDLREFRKRLIEARANALNGVNAMKATGFNEADDHEADGGDGTNQTLRLQALGQMGNINRVIQSIDEALHRIDDGTYGVCTICGQLIRKPRLLNQPFVLTCMECQSEVERNNR